VSQLRKYREFSKPGVLGSFAGIFRILFVKTRLMDCQSHGQRHKLSRKGTGGMRQVVVRLADDSVEVYGVPRRTGSWFG